MNKKSLFTCFVLLSIFFSHLLYAEKRAGDFEITGVFASDQDLQINISVDGNFQNANQIYITISSLPEVEILWNGKAIPKPGPAEGELSLQVKNLEPRLWSPAQPQLYNVDVKVIVKEKLLSSRTIRTGFKTFSTKNGQLFLNGKPIFLRGIAINPPGRGIPADLESSRAFAEDYVRFMLSRNVNVIRIPDNQHWYDVCDEMGMMVFGGNYGATVAGQRPPADYDKGVDWYKYRKLGPITHHPSLIIYALTNEVPYTGEIAEKWEQFLSYAHSKLKLWDPNRLFIGNAGYGYGRSGDICDLHRYWGWYYSSPFTFLNIRENSSIIPFDKGVQPVTFTECVGNYTGPDGRYNLTPNHKNPVSQLCWTGHAGQSIQATLASDHQCFTFKQAAELFRRLRYINPELAGIFPFTTTFLNWHTVENFVDMDPKPVMEQAGISYQPVLLSWELWQTQIYSGSEIHPVAHIINDADDFTDLEDASLVYELRDKTNTVCWAGSIDLPDVPYYGTLQLPLTIKLPEILSTEEYHLYGTVLKDEQIVSENSTTLFVAARSFAQSGPIGKKQVLIYDPSGHSFDAIATLGQPVRRLNSLGKLDPHSLLIIGENAAGEQLDPYSGHLKSFIRKGGRLICLRQDSLHLPYLNGFLPAAIGNVVMNIDNSTYPPPERPSRNGFNINPERTDHPVFIGLERGHFRTWSDYSGWNEKEKGFPAIYPVTDGFILADKSDIAITAVLANYSIGLEGIALAEMFEGKGSAMVCGFDLVRRSGIDPVADRMLANLVSYMQMDQDHEIHPLIEAPIVWGEYQTEKGVLTGIYSGFMLNSRPRLTGSYRFKEIVVHSDGHQFAERPGGWNNRAGIQYVPYGRRMFGPYHHRGFGGVPEPDDVEKNVGTGMFWCRVPNGTTAMYTNVWNPTAEPLKIWISINDTQVSEEIIEPNKYRQLESAVGQTTNAVKISMMGDRRMVILETSFTN